MTDKLPSADPLVNDKSLVFCFYPTDEDFKERIREIVSDVKRFVTLQPALQESTLEVAARLAIDTVDDLKRRGLCVCQRCCQSLAQGSSAVYYALRCEVLRRYGRPASKIAHRPDTGQQ